MVEPPPKSFPEELRERRIGQWAIAYLGGAWLLLQVLDVLSDTFAVPIGLRQGIIVLVAFGFLVTVVLAWYHGDRGRQRVSGPELIMVAALTILAGTALYVVRSAGGGGASADAFSGSPATADPGGDLGNPVAPNPASQRHVAVLPFLDISPEGDQAYFADGMTEELLNALAQLADIRVAARTSSFAFRDSGLSVQEIGQRLAVGTIVEGSVRKSEDRLRVTAQLVSVEDGYQLWSNQFDREPEDVFAVQEEIAGAIADALDIRLRGEPGELSVPGQTQSHEAQDLYLRGRFAWNRRSQESLEQAVEYFQRATALDPGYARAFVGLGDAYAVLGFYDYRPPAEAFPLAQRAARRALEIEPALAEAHATLGYAALYHDWDWEVAEAEFLRSIELDPTYPVAHQWYANFLTAMGRFTEAVSSIRRATELDPLSMIAHAATGWVYYYGGDFEAAVRQLDESIERDPTFELSYLWQGWALEELGRYEEAVARLRTTVDLSGGSVISRLSLAHALAGSGQAPEARAILAEIEAPGFTTYVPAYELARAHAGLGQVDRAVAILERGFEERSHSMVFSRVDPQLAPLAGNAGYERLLVNLRLVEGA